MNYLLIHLDIFDLIILMVSVPVIVGLFGVWYGNRRVKEYL